MVKYKDEDIVGRRFGKLTVISIFHKIEKSGRKAKFCKCKCDCEKEKDIRIDALINNSVISCGCFSKKQSSERMKKIATLHGLSHHPLYGVWDKIVDRCENQNHCSYKNYGGRGIKICNEWRNNPEVFINWALNNGWKKELTVDRIDVNGNYEPNNCRFVDRHVQSANQRKSIKNKSGYVGITWDNSRNKWISWLSINNKTYNLGRFISKKDALDKRNNFIIKNKLFEYKIQEWEGK